MKGNEPGFRQMSLTYSAYGIIIPPEEADD